MSILDPKRERTDDRIRAEELRQGDELHLTFMGGDEYVTVVLAETNEGITRLRFLTWGGYRDDELSADRMVWIKRRGRDEA